jgi:hypothetical protein
MHLESSGHCTSQMQTKNKMEGDADVCLMDKKKIQCENRNSDDGEESAKNKLEGKTN